MIETEKLPAASGQSVAGKQTESAALSVELQRPFKSDNGVKTFIGERELLARLPISRRTLFNWRTSGKIPFVHLGGRRVLFHWPSVETALLRHQRNGD